ncbi:S8 family serine peptidase [Aquimarina brevivitae]|uniref:Putative secreted protein (Por secretion system target) n=1 Tax=Aquimarina brevivitae TaxID=323412 RepID=A0A4Q7PG48_9FLAO|nr:S8 family serine peptidase [Aquimarina brevivitae]RZS99127.1 putative secreted protein (Por secretion system target) [Aquimarina brevivitae]
MTNHYNAFIRGNKASFAKVYQLPLSILSLLFLFSFGAFAQSPAQKQQIIQKTNVTKLSQFQAEIAKQVASEKQAALAAAQRNGWQVKMNNADGSFSELQKVVTDENGNEVPVYYTTFNVAAARSTRANHLNAGGSLGLNLDGQNMVAYVWDGGHARVTHQEYDGAGGNNRVTVEDAASEGGTQLNFHAAHVTGTITASGVQANAKGMAPQSRVRGYMWNDDVAEATAAAANGMLLSNHSYGYRSDLVPDQYFGAYIDVSRSWDELMYNAPYYLMVVAAGNDGNANSYNGAPLDGNSSYDKLTGHSTSKNNLVVANAQDANVSSDGSLNSVSINSSSSEGPTDDYRIKPDITGNGTSVYSTYASSDTAYNSITGTSMASPNVTGTLLLLQQHYDNINGSFMKAATLKGLALHTADDAGSNGPDAVFGWGLLNAKAAAEAISSNTTGESKIEELTLTSGQTYSVTVDADGVNPLMASISWTDAPGAAVTATNSNTPVLVNDLDIRVTKNSTTYQPYRLTGVTTNGTGDNTVDPYERIDVAGASGTYTITVTHKGSLTGGSQDFSLIVTGLTGTPVVCNATTPTGVNTSNVTYNSASVSWTAVPAATYDVRYRAAGTTSWTTVAATGTSVELTGLTELTSYEVQVRSKCDDGTTSSYSSSATFTTPEFQLVYCDSNGQSVADEYISNVTLESINNNSGAGSGGYTDFTGISTDLAKDGTYTISVSPTWTGQTYSEGYSAWIDYNQDGDFADAGEQVWTQAATQNTTVSGSFTIPTTALDGATRMRVSMKYNGVPTPCEAFQYGEVEDYTIVIGGTPPDTQAPTAPGSLTAADITQTTVSLSWNASSDNVGVTGYDVYRSNTVIATVTGTSYEVTGLTADTAYSFRIKAKDEAGNESAFSNTTNVTTLGDDPAGCSTGISTFPYAEGFEGNIGAWSQSTADDLNWTVDAGGTPSNGTGPSSAVEGSDYIFVEASGNGTGYPNKQAIITSPCFDLSGLSTPNFSFSYHMYGASDMGSIALEASTDEGASWTSIWSETGNQGNAWLDASVNLSAYAGGGVQLRFNRITGGTWQADVAIDNVSLTNEVVLPCTDVTLSITLDNYPEETSWQIRNSSNQVVASGGTYGSQPDGSTVTVTECLDAGTYTFIINDSYGDGICCSYGNGSYALTSAGTTLASGGAFGSSETTTFTIGSGTNAAFFESMETTEPITIGMYPNPLEGNKILNVTSTKEDLTYMVRDMLGRTISQGKVTNRQIDMNQLQAGVYMVTLDANSKKPYTEKVVVKQ